jgi:hypothetical protein
MNTTAIAANTCDTAVTAALTSVTANTKIAYNPSSDPSAMTGYGPGLGLSIWAFPVATSRIGFRVCNNSSTAVTRGTTALTINWIAFP